MGLDINESVTPKLIWDVSLASGKGGEDYNLMDVTPLALWDPNGATKDCETDGSFLEDELEPSEWVSTMIKGFGSFVGFPIACCERQCIDFFKKLEKVWEKQATIVNTRRVGISSQKGMRELKILISTVNYEGQSGRNTRGRLKASGVGFVCLSMNLKLLSWNVRELNNPHKRLVVTNLLKEWKCDIVCLQETKLDNTSSNMVKSL